MRVDFYFKEQQKWHDCRAASAETRDQNARARKQQIQTGHGQWERADAGHGGRTCLASPTFQGANGRIHSVTTSRIGNDTRLAPSLGE